MARARGKIDRSHQVHRWLQATFDTPMPTVLRFGDHNPNEYGRMMEGKDRLVITLTCGKYPIPILFDTLLHEYAHAMVHPLEHHCARWGRAYARVFTGFIDEGGSRKSWEF